MSDPDDFFFDFNDGPPTERVPGVAVVPLPPEPVVVEGPVTISYVGEVDALLKDCALMRSKAMRINPKTREEEIWNPVLFEKAVARRQSILSAAVKLHTEIWNREAQMEFYRIMVDVIRREAPAVAHRLIAELRKINSPVLGALDEGNVSNG